MFKAAEPRIRTAVASFLTAGLVLATSACSGAKPYQRGRLAQPRMQLGEDAQASQLEQHVYEYREGSSGGYGTRGGGCGCN